MEVATAPNVEEKPKYKLASAELEAVLSPSYLASPGSSDADISVTSIALPEDATVSSTSVISARGRRRPLSPGTSSRSTSSAASSDFYIGRKSLIDDTSSLSCAASSISGDQQGLAFIANIGDMTKDDEPRSVCSRRSRKSRISTKSRKRGESLERDISLTILQTATSGAGSAHFLVSDPATTSPIKSAEEILSDLFVSQDVSLDTIALETTLDSGTLFIEKTKEGSTKSIAESSVFSFPQGQTNPEDDIIRIQMDPAPFDCIPLEGASNDEEKEEKEMEKLAISPIQKVDSEDSLFAFSDVNRDAPDPPPDHELLFQEMDSDGPSKRFSLQGKISEDPAEAESYIETSTACTDNAVVVFPRSQAFTTGGDVLAIATQDDRAAEVAPRESVPPVSTTDGTSEVQHALSVVSTSDCTLPEINEEMTASTTDREVDDDSTDTTASTTISGRGGEEEPTEEDVSGLVKREEFFLDTLVSIVAIARERPKKVEPSQCCESSSECNKEGEDDEKDEASRPDDEVAANDSHSHPYSKVDSSQEGNRGINSQDEFVSREPGLGDLVVQDAPPVRAPDPELDDFIESHGFGASDDDGEDGEGWTEFDASPFSKEASGSTAPERSGASKPSPESPTSITGFSAPSDIRETAKRMWWWERDTYNDDVLSI